MPTSYGPANGHFNSSTEVIDLASRLAALGHSAAAQLRPAAFDLREDLRQSYLADQVTPARLGEETADAIAKLVEKLADALGTVANEAHDLQAAMEAGEDLTRKTRRANLARMQGMGVIKL